MTETPNVQANNSAWSEDTWAQIGIDTVYETALETHRVRAWLPSSPPFQVADVAREPTSYRRFSPTPLVATARILESAVHGALKTSVPWTQVKFDQVLRLLCDAREGPAFRPTKRP